MARTYTRSQMRTRIRALVDHENDTFPADAVYNDWIDVAYARLWALLVESGLGYFAETTESWVTTGSTGVHAVPADFGWLLALEYSDTDGWRELERLDERNLAAYTTTNATYPAGFRMNGANVVLMPTPASGQTYRIRYLAAPSKFTNDADTIDGVAGWEDYIAQDVAAKVRQREEADPRPFLQERAAIEARIAAEAQNRTLYRTHRIQNTDQRRLDAVQRAYAPWESWGWWR